MLPLPQELIDAIVENFHGDRQALLKLAPVSVSFVVAARRHLFYQVTLAKSRGFQRLHRLLQTSPDISRYIRYLRLVDIRSANDSVITVSVLKAQHNVKSLELVDMVIEHVPADILTEIKNFDITSLTLVGVRFITHDAFHAFLCSYPRLRSLTLRSVTITREEHTPPPRREEPKLVLETLTLINPASCVYERALSPYISRLKKLVVSGVQAGSSIPPLLAATSHHLQEINVFYPGFLRSNTSFTPNDFPALAKIPRITLMLYENLTLYFQDVSWLAESLKYRACDAAYVVHIVGRLQGKPTFAEVHGWSALDDVCGENSTILVTLSNAEPHKAREVFFSEVLMAQRVFCIEKIKEQMPKAMERGSLRFDEAYSQDLWEVPYGTVIGH